MEQQIDGELAELDVMRSVAEALGGLDDSAKKRVLKWAVDRFGVLGLGDSQVFAGGSKTATGTPQNREQPTEHDQYPDLPALYGAANPKTQSEKALVVGYWFQAIEGQTDLDSQQINTALKNLGHGAANITRALEDLIATRPQAVIQTRKSGTSKQARKKYRLTNEGIGRVKQMLTQVNGSGGSTADAL
jgi:hypothetical protein